MGRGLSTLRRAVLTGKENSHEEPEVFARNLETSEIFWETQSSKVKISGRWRFLGQCLLKIWYDIPDYWKDFYLHLVLLKQHLLELSPPINGKLY